MPAREAAQRVLETLWGLGKMDPWDGYEDKSMSVLPMSMLGSPVSFLCVTAAAERAAD